MPPRGPGGTPLALRLSEGLDNTLRRFDLGMPCLTKWAPIARAPAAATGQMYFWA
jgi:hypothetical protein